MRAISFPTSRLNSREYGIPTASVGTAGDMNKCSVYILRSLKNDSLYIGSASDISRRLKQHNGGNVKATRYRCPYKLEFSQEYPDTITARRIECKLKKWKRRDYLERIIKDGKIKGD